MEQKRPADIFQELLDYLWNGLGLEEKGWKHLKNGIFKKWLSGMARRSNWWNIGISLSFAICLKEKWPDGWGNKFSFCPTQMMSTMVGLLVAP